MVQLANKNINAEALIAGMVRKSRAAQSSIRRSSFAIRCAALHAAAKSLPSCVTHNEISGVHEPFHASMTSSGP